MRTCATHLVSSPILYHCQVWKIVLGIWGLRFLFVFGFVVKQVWVLSLAAKSLTWRSPKQAQLQRWFNMVPSHPPPPVVMITGCTRKSRVEHHKHLCQSSQLVQVRPRGGSLGEPWLEASSTVILLCGRSGDPEPNQCRMWPQGDLRTLVLHPFQGASSKCFWSVSQDTAPQQLEEV
jgi:hypothetical protein